MDSGRFCAVSDQTSGQRFVCFSSRTHGRFSLSLTDAANVWTKVFTDDEEEESVTQKLGLKSIDDVCHKLRSTVVQVQLQEAEARLSLVSGSDSVVLDLTKMAAAAAAQEVKQLLFKMADNPSSANGASASKSPTKSLQRRATDFEPRQQNSAPLVTAKKRLPGSSLINPGTKKKRAATGVAFDDPNDD